MSGGNGARGLTPEPQAQEPIARDLGGLTPESPPQPQTPQSPPEPQTPESPPQPQPEGSDPLDTSAEPQSFGVQGSDPRPDLSQAVEAPETADPEFEIVSAEPVPRSVEPALSFKGKITDASMRPIYMIALTAIVVVEPGKRSYQPGERERLMELFGGPERWASTTGAFRWAATQTMVHGFTGEGAFEMVVPVSYDLEIASAKYFGALDEGGFVPLRFHFNGSVLYERGDGRVQMAPVAWDRSERFEMPMEAWTRLTAEHHPFRNWVPLHSETVTRIESLKAGMGAPTFDDAVSRILKRAEQEDVEDL